jgi:hypothetical protein
LLSAITAKVGAHGMRPRAAPEFKVEIRI